MAAALRKQIEHGGRGSCSSDSAIPFGFAEAALSAKLYKSARRPRGREIDLAIAACPISRQAELWTLNTSDFVDLPGLRLMPSA